MLGESEKNADSCEALPEDGESGTRSTEIVQQFALFGTASFLLAMSLEAADKESARELFKFADFLGCSFSDSPVFDSDAYSTLSYAVGGDVLSKFHRDEFYYQELFKEFASVVVPDCEVITRAQTRYDKPDAWISVNGDDVPVEVKLGEFDKKAMKQLERYMSVYECEYGVAVGKTTDIEPWPDNVFWVSTATLDELEKQTHEYKKRILERNERTIRNLEVIKAFFKEMLSPDVWEAFERTLNSDAKSTG